MSNWVVFINRYNKIDIITISAAYVYNYDEEYVFVKSDEEGNEQDVALIPRENVIAISDKDNICNYKFDILEDC